jgi:hypothetical protein
VRNLAAAALTLVALVSLACGSLLVLSGRGLLGHLPGAEVVIDECRSAGGGTVRLYEGNLGATTSYWYLATLQPGFFSAERDFFQAYGWPAIGAVECQGGEIELLGADGQVEFSFGIDRIRAELLEEPLSLYDGEPAEGRPSGPLPRVLGLLCGSPLMLVGAVAGLAVFRHRPRNR